MKIDDRDYRKESMEKKKLFIIWLFTDFVLVRDWTRIEFNRHRTLKDLGEIRTQIALGRRNLNELKLSMKMAS
jgi:hypothetical protein